MRTTLQRSWSFLLFTALITLLACGDDRPATAPAARVAQVQLTPDHATLDVGTTLPLRAIPRDVSGTPLENRAIAWTSIDPSVATVSSNGTLVAIAAGSTVITATSEGIVGQANVTVTTPRVPVARVDLDRSADTLAIGGTEQLAATARDAAGLELPDRTAAWTSSDAAVASVSQTGLVTAIGVGRATITAAVEGRAASAEITVIRVPGPAAGIRIDRATLSLGEGSSATLLATVVDAYGLEIPGVLVTWQSEQSDVATVDDGGHVIAVRVGYARVRAIAGNLSAWVPVTVQGIPNLAHDLAYDADPGILGQGPLLYLLDIRLADAEPRRAFAHPGTWEVTASPDDSKLAFVTRGWLTTEIVVSDRDGSNPRIIATGFGGQDQPAWSPDGTQIAFRRWAPGGPPGIHNPADIWVMNVDGSNQRNLTSGGDASLSMSNPAWSPKLADGSYRIAYSAQRLGGGYLTGSVYSMRADGSDVRRISAAGSQLDDEPSWSPQGNQVVFVRTGATSDGDLWVANVDPLGAGLSERGLMATWLPGAQQSPAWSPDGRLIAFLSSHAADARGAYRQVWTVWNDGTKLARRTYEPIDKSNPAWVVRTP